MADESQADNTTSRADQLTSRQELFIREYLIDLNATQAALRAGYSPTSAAESGCELLKLSKVAEAVERGKAQRAIRVGMSQDAVLHEMALLANSDLDHYMIDDDGQVKLTFGAPEGAMRAVQSIKKKTRLHFDKEGNVTGKTYDVELKLWDKPTPLKLMGKHVGIFPDRVEVSGKNGGPIEVTKVVREVVRARPEEENT